MSSEITSRELTVIKIAEAKNILSSNRIKIEEIWDKFLLDLSRPDSSPSTLRTYKSIVNIFTEWLMKAYPATVILSQVTNDIGAGFANFLWQERKVSELKYAGLKTTETSENLQRKRKICRYGFHSFRHTYASMMASKDYSINMLR